MSRVEEKFILAVSGGVDSVVLLDAIMINRVNSNLSTPKFIDFRNRVNNPSEQIIIAHVDHGIREESSEDAEFVEKLAHKYHLKFELFQVKLGKGASEAKAREVRYNFLRQCCKKYKASKIITAHHQDDLIETIILNIIRGTSWRGLTPFQDGSIVRPLLEVSKETLINYATTNGLTWKEDSTNEDQIYLRNYIRHKIIPEITDESPNFVDNMVDIYKSTLNLRIEIEKEINRITVKSVSKYEFIMWPENVAKEVIYCKLRMLDPEWHPSNHQVEKALLFIKTSQCGKKIEISKTLSIRVGIKTVDFLFQPLM